ncbi:high-potential iron-sulfur protein [Hydrogenophaga sp.]|uniref:high-potential iron-sulfur protein n=1 Tax=Hydrogenophaga sp. TaxID=1904254 RepID=UPI00272F6763|nr:high-potential iron-sulfur protein [Hydrogenophaga sp.]MDP1685457.1 high-potential iron-sulfur protein [Hydrogenophaga sp.]
MNGSNRRVFMLQVAAGSTALMAASAARSQAAMVGEKDAQAVALGYVADSTKVDAKKFPKHAATQLCSNCQVYAGKPADPAGPCAIFPGKLVAGKGWCSAYVKKAG